LQQLQQQQQQSQQQSHQLYVDTLDRASVATSSLGASQVLTARRYSPWLPPDLAAPATAVSAVSAAAAAASGSRPGSPLAVDGQHHMGHPIGHPSAGGGPGRWSTGGCEPDTGDLQSVGEKSSIAFSELWSTLPVAGPPHTPRVPPGDGADPASPFPAPPAGRGKADPPDDGDGDDDDDDNAAAVPAVAFSVAINGAAVPSTAAAEFSAAAATAPAAAATAAAATAAAAAPAGSTAHAQGLLPPSVLGPAHAGLRKRPASAPRAARGHVVFLASATGRRATTAAAYPLSTASPSSPGQGANPSTGAPGKRVATAGLATAAPPLLLVRRSALPGSPVFSSSAGGAPAAVSAVDRHPGKSTPHGGAAQRPVSAGPFRGPGAGAAGARGHFEKTAATSRPGSAGGTRRAEAAAAASLVAAAATGAVAAPRSGYHPGWGAGAQPPRSGFTGSTPLGNGAVLRVEKARGGWAGHR
jgi:hypothetical protein